MIQALARRYWREIALSIAIAVLIGTSLSWIESQRQIVYDKGKRDCEAASAAKIEEWRQAYEAQRVAAMLDHEQRSTAYQQAAAPIKERIVREVEARTDRNCLSADAERLLEEQRQAANLRFTAPTHSAVPSDPS